MGMESSSLLVGVSETRSLTCEALRAVDSTCGSCEGLGLQALMAPANRTAAARAEPMRRRRRR